MTALLTLIESAQEFGFEVERPTAVAADGRRSVNPRSIDGYTTLVRGPVRIAVSNIGLYYHDHRVWWSDPTENHPSRVTVWTVLVEPEARRQGRATEALQALQRLCEARGLWLQLEASPIAGQRAKGQRTISRRRLIGWYESLGFEPSYPGEGREILEWRPDSHCPKCPISVFPGKSRVFDFSPTSVIFQVFARDASTSPPRSPPMTNPHLTPEQRQTLVDLFAQADAAEALRCVAGIVGHGIDDLTVALDVKTAILKVANDVAKYERSRYTITKSVCTLASGEVITEYLVTDTRLQGALAGCFSSIHAAKSAFPGATVLLS